MSRTAMPSFPPASPLRRCGAAAVVLGIAAGALAQTAQPTPYELELWRSAAQLNTTSSYRAYLDAFPSGAFAPMARAALEKIGAPPVAAAAGTPAAAGAAKADLQAWTGSAESGLMPATPGQRYIGPGILEAGSSGARRQIVVPGGEWVVLAAFDGRTANTMPVTTSTLLLGRFVGKEARSLLWVHFNSRPVTVSSSNPTFQAMGMAPRWSVAERCESADGSDLHEVRTSLRGIRRCLRASMAPGEAQALIAETPGLQARLDAALASLGARLGAGLIDRSEVHLSDNRSAYTGYVRFDCAAPDEQPACEPPARAQAAPEAARKRLPPFAAAAERGFLWHHDLQALRPGSADPAAVKALNLL